MSVLRDLGLCAIPEKKLMMALADTLKSCEVCSEKTKLHESCPDCRGINQVLQRYADCNIPVKYWDIEIDDQFLGDKILKEKFLEVTKNLQETYRNGTALCFAGGHGTGKTTVVCNILKKALTKGFLKSIYVSLNDIIVALVNNQDGRAALRMEFLTADFLVIDEFDPRHMGSDNASDLFGRLLEDIIRIRSQNTLPTFMCTNSPNVIESFHGPLKQSISSLMNYFTMIPVLGKDLRKSGL